MQIVTRRLLEEIEIEVDGKRIYLAVLSDRGNGQYEIGLDAPADVRILTHDRIDDIADDAA